MTRDWWQTDPTYVIDDPPKGFECPPILNFVGQMTRDNGLPNVQYIRGVWMYYVIMYG